MYVYFPEGQRPFTAEPGKKEVERRAIRDNNEPDNGQTDVGRRREYLLCGKLFYFKYFFNGSKKK